jgi:CRP-like cAMP-binding protein
MMNELLYKSFSQIYPLTTKDFEQITNIIQYKKFKKDELILDFGQIEKSTKLVVSGIVQQTILIDDELFTTDISLSGMYFNNLKSYLEETPSIETQIAITEVEVLFTFKEEAEKLRYNNHAFCYIYAKSWEKTHLEREKRSYLLQNKNAYKRFELFMQTNEYANRYLQEVPQKIVASYLNLTPETFSRVKKEYLLKN